MTDNMVERVGNAIPNYDYRVEGLIAWRERAARAAIEAMRVPTKEMLEAGMEANDGDHFDWIDGDEWKAMISAALEEK